MLEISSSHVALQVKLADGRALGCTAILLVFLICQLQKSSESVLILVCTEMQGSIPSCSSGRAAVVLSELCETLSEDLTGDCEGAWQAHASDLSPCTASASLARAIKHSIRCLVSQQPLRGGCT